MTNFTNYSTIFSVVPNAEVFTTNIMDFPNTTLFLNGSVSNTSTSANEFRIGDHTILQVVMISIVAVFLMASTVLGNLLVIVAYRKNRRLRTINNMFLVSLAFSDLIIGLVSMTLYPIYMITRKWMLGKIVCDIWLCIDYTLSMASVANLLLICFDRYFSVTRPFSYRAKRTRQKTKVFIAAAWVFSFLLWSPAIVIWPIVRERTVRPDECYIQFLKESTTLTVVTAILAFFLPVIIMCVLYGFIYRETRKCSQYLEYLKSYSKPRASSPFLHLRRPFHRASTPSSSPHIDANSTRSQNRRRFLSLDQGPQGSIGGRVRVSSLSIRNAQSDQSVLEAVHGRTRSSSSASRLSAKPLIRNGEASAVKLLSPSGSEEVFIPPKETAKPATSTHSSSFWKRLKMRLNIRSRNRSSDGEKKMDCSDKTTDSLLSTAVHGAQNNRQSDIVNSYRQKPVRRSVPSMSISPPPMEETNKEKRTRKTSQDKNIDTSQNTIKMPSSEKKAGRTLSAILLAFLITWLPYNICAVYICFCNDHSCVPVWVWDTAYYLCYINSTLNPFCFALCNKSFRKAFKQILTCQKRRNFNFDVPHTSRNKKKKGGLVHAASSSSSRTS